MKTDTIVNRSIPAPLSLELFSGTGSVSTELRSQGFDTWTVDINPRFSPSICCNILDFPYNSFPGQFSFIWASPDCRYFSRLQSLKHWRKITLKYRQYRYIPASNESSKALLLVIKTIEIIRHYNPPVWFIENPCGRMRHIPELQQFAPFRYSVNYKDYGFSYSKETDLFTNLYLPLQQSKVIRSGPGVVSVNNRITRSAVPGQLIQHLLLLITNNCPGIYEKHI